MNGMIPLLLILLFLTLGMLVGLTRWLRGGKSVVRLLDACIYALLFSMGMRIAESEAIRTQIARVGLIAASLAVAAVLGTALVVGVAAAIGSRRRRIPAVRADEADSGPAVAMVHLKDPLRLFAAVIAGFLVGYFVPFITVSRVAQITTALLYLLVTLVGLQLARSGLDVKATLLHPRNLLVPAGTVVGSLGGALVLAPLLSLPASKALSVAAGFGWYSLAGVLITNLGDPVLGSAAFVANILREEMALLLIPLLARTNLGEVAVGIAGATSMDVTLPIIGRSCGPSCVPLAVASGAILSFLVPILVPVLYHL